jgi:hypothetical protein
MDETFEYIKGYENLYKINKKGEIWSCIYKKIRKLTLSEDGYLVTSLSKEGNVYKTSIHRLIALQYIDNPNNLSHVDHIDRNRLNNSLDNLRWVTHQENMLNRHNNLSNLNEEELKIRKEKIKQYKTEWAKQDRASKGVPIKSEMIKSKDPNYKANWAKEKRANMTPEEKEAYLAKRREQRKNKSLNDLDYNAKNAKRSQENRDKMTPEEKEVYNSKRKEQRKNKIVKNTPLFEN